MNAVQQIKQTHDLDALLRAIAPRMEDRREARKAAKENGAA